MVPVIGEICGDEVSFFDHPITCDHPIVVCSFAHASYKITGSFLRFGGTSRTLE